MSIVPLTTLRLHLRLMNETDVDTMARYRSIDQIAKFQDWPIPYTVDLAVASLAKQSALVDVTCGHWVSIAIELDGTVIGDVALGLSDDGVVATLGYTLVPEHHGRGFAREAVDAVVDALFEHTTVQRIVATLDPANGPSMRLLESIGFRYEGLLREAIVIAASGSMTCSSDCSAPTGWRGDHAAYRPRRAYDSSNSTQPTTWPTGDSKRTTTNSDSSRRLRSRSPTCCSPTCCSPTPRGSAPGTAMHSPLGQLCR